MSYNIGDRFTAKNYTEFEIINIFPHYNGVIITIKYKRDTGQLSSFYEKNFTQFLEDRKYKLELGQVTLGVAI